MILKKIVDRKDINHMGTSGGEEDFLWVMVGFSI